jgi:type II secretory pathway pseudopilin PulG
LLVVISIIGLLSSIVFTSVQESRKRARNTAVIVSVGQYLKAFELMKQSGTTFASLGMLASTIPMPIFPYCLGKAPVVTNNLCGSNQQNVSVNENFNNSISTFIADSPNPMPRALSWFSYDLGSFFYFTDESTLNVVWLIEGVFYGTEDTKICGLGASVLYSDTSSEATYCLLANHKLSL